MTSLFDALDPSPTLGEIERRDPCAKRHGGNPESAAAWEHKSNADSDRAQVLALVMAAGTYGLTLDEACARLERAPNQLSGRVTELLQADKIMRSGRKRKTRAGSTAAVYVAMTQR